MEKRKKCGTWHDCMFSSFFFLCFFSLSPPFSPPPTHKSLSKYALSSEKIMSKAICIHVPQCFCLSVLLINAHAVMCVILLQNLQSPRTPDTADVDILYWNWSPVSTTTVTRAVMKQLVVNFSPWLVCQIKQWNCNLYTNKLKKSWLYHQKSETRMTASILKQDPNT